MAAARSEDLLLRAKGYPFDPPRSSFCWIDGQALWLQHLDASSLLQSTVSLNGGSIRLAEYPGIDQQPAVQRLDQRVPVLAHGSNASPAQLSRKFAASPESLIPVLRGDLHDFDVVYAAHVTGYGSLPATLQYCPGTVAHIFVTYLDDEQLATMHRTEAAGKEYSYVELAGVRLELPELGTMLPSVFAYLNLFGCLTVDGSCIALEAVNAGQRRFLSLSETEALEAARGLVSPEVDLDDFICANILDPSKRALTNDQLTRHSRPFAYRQVRA